MEKAKQPTGSVTGTVYCADTNAPARLATVMLVPASGRGTVNPVETRTETDLDGRFTISKVPHGTYYVSVEFAGYRNSVPIERNLGFKPLTEDERKRLGPSVPKVTLANKQQANVSIRLERGGEIDGTVLYDDGSPAVGLHVSVRPKTSTSDATRMPEHDESFGAENSSRVTDDHGRFRLLGFPPGEYLLSVVVPTASANEAEENFFAKLITMSLEGGLTVYYGDTLRASKAEAIKIGDSDSTKDAEITIPLSKLHTVRGHVIFKSNGEAPPTVTLELVYADNHEVARFILATDGEFVIPYVPEDSYLLRAQGLRQRLPTFYDGDGGDEGSLFQPDKNGWGEGPDGGAEIPLAVAGDVSGLTISVPDPPAKSEGAGGGPSTAPR